MEHRRLRLQAPKKQNKPIDAGEMVYGSFSAKRQSGSCGTGERQSHGVLGQHLENLGPSQMEEHKKPLKHGVGQCRCSQLSSTCLSHCLLSCTLLNTHQFLGTEHADRTPTHNTHLCSTVFSQARQAHTTRLALKLYIIFVRQNKCCHLV